MKRRDGNGDARGDGDSGARGAKDNTAVDKSHSGDGGTINTGDEEEEDKDGSNNSKRGDIRAIPALQNTPTGAIRGEGKPCIRWLPHS